MGCCRRTGRSTKVFAVYRQRVMSVRQPSNTFPSNLIPTSGRQLNSWTDKSEASGAHFTGIACNLLRCQTRTRPGSPVEGLTRQCGVILWSQIWHPPSVCPVDGTGSGVQTEQQKGNRKRLFGKPASDRSGTERSHRSLVRVVPHNGGYVTTYITASELDWEHHQ